MTFYEAKNKSWQIEKKIDRETIKEDSEYKIHRNRFCKGNSVELGKYRVTLNYIQHQSHLLKYIPSVLLSYLAHMFS